MELLVLLSIVVLVVLWPRTACTAFSVLILTAACLRYANAGTLEVSAIIESEADRATMQDAVREAAMILHDELDLVVSVTDISTVAGHTHAGFLLDAVQAYRVDHPQHLAADVTVLFTRRDLRRGTENLAGIATVGPACSANASAIVEIANDGNDGAILAHELLHTVGVPHDEAPGWLMSKDTWSRFIPRTLSPDTISTVRAAGLGECISTTVATPPTATGNAPPAAFSSGGGGAMDSPLFLVLLLLLALWREVRKLTADREGWRRHALKRLDAINDANTRLQRIERWMTWPKK